ncbi:hypothetical protein [Dyella sp.]|uniref:hypothetical protein n=1 Tax=Dyella sp. TaxID=1869338 RepID=UPI002ED2D1E0
MTTEDDIKAMAVKLAMLVDSFETRGDAVVQQNLQAAHTITRSAEDAAHVARQMTHQAVEEFREIASETLGKSLREPLSHADNTLQASMQGIRDAVHDLERRVQSTAWSHSVMAWKVFIACTLASAAVVGAAIYFGMQARTQTIRADWATQINAAIADGNLAPCAGGGICARVDAKHWVRLDQPAADTHK